MTTDEHRVAASTYQQNREDLDGIVTDTDASD